MHDRVVEEAEVVGVEFDLVAEATREVAREHERGIPERLVAGQLPAPATAHP